jgi:hypothetical protein
MWKQFFPRTLASDKCMNILLNTHVHLFVLDNYEVLRHELSQNASTCYLYQL